MEGTLSRRRMLGGVCTAAVGLLAGCSGMTPFVGKRTEESRRIAVEDASSLSVAVDVGDLTLRTADREDIHVDIVRESSSVSVDLSDLEFRVERRDGALRLEGEWNGDSGLSGAPSMDLSVTLPRSLPVDQISSSVADIDVMDVRGDLRIESETGEVTVENVAGSVRTSVETGSVAVANVDGAVDVRARTGEITVTDVGSLAGATTQTGELTVDVPAIEGDTTLRAETGRISAAIGEVDAELDARTDVGSIDVGEIGLTNADVTSSSVTGTLGDGGPALEIRSETGQIVLEPLA